jgi:hypothetical protein
MSEPRPTRIPSQGTRTAGYYSGVDAARITGLTYRQVDYADRRDIVKPTVSASGSGTARGYTVNDLVALAVVGELRTRLTPDDGPNALDPPLERLLAGSAYRGERQFTATLGDVTVYVDVDAVRDRVHRAVLAYAPSSRPDEQDDR